MFFCVNILLERKTKVAWVRFPAVAKCRGGKKLRICGYHPWGRFSSEESSKWKHVKQHIKHTMYECRESQNYLYFEEGCEFWGRLWILRKVLNFEEGCEFWGRLWILRKAVTYPEESWKKHFSDIFRTSFHAVKRQFILTR